MPAPPQQQQDNSLGPIWIMLTLAAVFAGIWFLAHAAIVGVIFKIKLAEISVVSLFTNKLGTIKGMINNIPPSAITFSELSYICDAVGAYIRIPCAVILLLFAVFIYRAGSAASLTQTYSMKSLLDLEQKNWAQVHPVCGQDLIDTHVNKGAWAMSLTPMDFAKKYKLIIEETAPRKEGNLKREKTLLAKLDRGRAAAIFTLQLGPLWKGVDQLNAPTRAMFAMFAARAAGDRKLADQLREQFARGFDLKTGATDYSGVDKICKNYIDNKVVKKVLASHAYVYSVMPAMLTAARYDGVLASADFLWLKPTDRRLWFVLNTVGRQVPVAEVAGSFAHFKVEESLGRKVFVPMVDAAIDALEVAMGEIVYHPDEKDA
jgi:intracellular multiplication protein IcmP